MRRMPVILVTSIPDQMVGLLRPDHKRLQYESVCNLLSANIVYPDRTWMGVVHTLYDYADALYNRIRRAEDGHTVYKDRVESIRTPAYPNWIHSDNVTRKLMRKLQRWDDLNRLNNKLAADGLEFDVDMEELEERTVLDELDGCGYEDSLLARLAVFRYAADLDTVDGLRKIIRLSHTYNSLSHFWRWAFYRDRCAGVRGAWWDDNPMWYPRHFDRAGARQWEHRDGTNLPEWRTT